MRRKFLLVHNSIAGLASNHLADQVSGALTRRGASVVLCEPECGAPDLDRVDGEAFDAVIAAGGDGTFRAVAKRVGTRMPVGFVPMGTGNVLAHEIGLPRSADQLAGLLMSGREVEIEGGTANGEPFFLMAGAGFDGEVISRLNIGLKRKIGKAAYTGPVLAALARPAPMLEVEIDGRRHEARWVVVTKARHYGGSFLLAPGARLTGHRFVAVLFASKSRAVRIRQLIKLATGSLWADRSTRMMDAETVSIGCPVAQPVEIDGDPFGTTPLRISARGPRARLIVPDEYAAGIATS